MADNNKFILKNFQNVRNIIFPLGLIAVIGFLIRINFVSFDIPITLDGLIYFWYAIDLSQSGVFPSNYPEAVNNGWPTFLSIFFSFYESENFLDFMAIQRLISIIISVSTVIPIYFLCKKFVPNSFAIFGAGLFIFEPRIIQNSTLGITEPLTIFLFTFSLVLFLKNQNKWIYIAFALISLGILIRVEMIFGFIALSVGFFWRNRENRRNLIKYSICLGILFLILTPMIEIRLNTIGNDGIFSRIFYSSLNAFSESKFNDQLEGGSKSILFFQGIENFVKFLGWIMIPVFLIFVPYGIIILFKNRNFEKKFIIFSSIIISIPIIYALSNASDVRYMFTLYPLFCIASVLGIKNFSNRIRKDKIVVFLGLLLILFLSIYYLDSKIDLEHEREAYALSRIIANETQKINLYGPEAKFLPVQSFSQLETFPIVNSESNQIRLIDYGLPLTKDFKSVEEFLEFCKNNHITHLVLDGNDDPKIIGKAYIYENDFPFLQKIYDSKEDKFDYSLKIFKINY